MDHLVNLNTSSMTPPHSHCQLLRKNNIFVVVGYNRLQNNLFLSIWFQKGHTIIPVKQMLFPYFPTSPKHVTISCIYNEVRIELQLTNFVLNTRSNCSSVIFIILPILL